MDYPLATCPVLPGLAALCVMAGLTWAILRYACKPRHEEDDD